MAEIKSTMDLIMERTAGLSLSDEERAALKRTESQKKAKGLALKVLGGRITDRQMEKELAELDPAERNRFGRAVAWEFIKELDLLSFPAHVIGQALIQILPSLAKEVLDGLVDAAKNYRVETARQTALGYQLALTELAGRGISGSAVRPKVTTEIDQSEFKAGLAELLGVKEN